MSPIMILEIEQLLARLRNCIAPIRLKIIGSYPFLPKLQYCSIYCIKAYYRSLQE